MAPGQAERATGARRWSFRLLAGAAIPAFLLLCFEGVLRLAGFGYSAHFFQSRRIAGHAVWTDNQQFGRRFFPPGLERGSRPFQLDPSKPLGTIRIFVLGESAAMGDPDLKFGLPRMLEVLLRERFRDRRIEVINTAIVAINSHVILPIARDCAKRQGDLWVVYMGNNEMVGPFGAASVFGARAPALPLVRVGLWLKTTRVGQFLDATKSWLSRRHQPQAEWAGMEMMANQRVPHDSPAVARVYRNFERNLTDILDSGARAGVPTVLCTVPTNLRNCPPFASLHSPDLSAARVPEWQSAYDGGIGWLNQGNPTNALAEFAKAERINPEFADLAFRQAECYRALGMSGEAERCYQEACDKDALQFRADTTVNSIIRQAAVAFANRRVTLLDAVNLFAARSPEAITGAEFFYEHVHLTPEGNYLLALAVAEQVASALSLNSSQAWISQSECLHLLGFTDWNRHDAFTTILDRIQSAPFTNQLDHPRQLLAVQEQLARYRLATKPSQVRQQAEQVRALVGRFPQDADLRWNLATLLQVAGDYAAAEEQWRFLLQLQPQSALVPYDLAKLLDSQQRQSEALSFYQLSSRLDPGNLKVQARLNELRLRAVAR